jgi:hypothetical protein
MKNVKTLCLSLLIGLSFSFLNAQQMDPDRPGGKNKKSVEAVNYKGTNDKSSFEIKGAYTMSRQMITRGTQDTVLNTQQLKLYTNNYFIYVHPHDADSLAEYGIGTYIIQGGKIMEYPFYTSSGGARQDSFELLVNTRTNGYSQIINFPDQQSGNFILTEDYTNVSKKANTPMDGAWKEVMTTTITKNGEKTTDTHPVQFKVYESGYFIWVNTVTNGGTQHPISRYGYGTFKMLGKNQIQETNIRSTYNKSLVNKPVNIQIKFMGNNNYEQTIIGDNGDKTIERYERLH